MKIEADQGNKSRKRKRRRKGVLYNYGIYFLKMESVSKTWEVEVLGGGVFVGWGFLCCSFFLLRFLLLFVCCLGWFFNQELSA